MPETLAGLQTALTATRQVVAGITADQWLLPTPCTEWTVADLTAHIVLGNRMFAQILTGGPAPDLADGARADRGQIEGDRLPAYDEASDRLMAAFGSAGVLDQLFTVPFGTVPGSVALHLRITELLVHGWDLARATGQRIEVPDSLAEQELAFSELALSQVPPGRSPFAPPQPVMADAAPLDRLASLLGRPTT